MCETLRWVGGYRLVMQGYRISFSVKVLDKYAALTYLPPLKHVRSIFILLSLAKIAEILEVENSVWHGKRSQLSVCETFLVIRLLQIWTRQDSLTLHNKLYCTQKSNLLTISSQWQ